VLSVHSVQFKVTISIGIASATLSMSGIEALLRAADQALYQAKDKGETAPSLGRRRQRPGWPPSELDARQIDRKRKAGSPAG